MEFIRLKAERDGNPPTVTAVTDFDDGSVKNSFVRLFATTSAGLHIDRIAVTGIIMLGEHAYILAKRVWEEGEAGMTEDMAKHKEDCRMHKKLFTL